MKTLTQTIKITAITVLLGASVIWAQTISGDLQQAISAKTGMQTNGISSDGGSAGVTLYKVIVQYKTPPTASQFQQAASLGGTLLTQYGAVSAAHYSLPKAAVAALAADPNVAYMSLDRPVKGMLDITAQAVHSDVANSSGYDGSGIGVAVIDSGILDRSDFAGSRGSRVLYNQSFVGGGATDQYGHGTHVAGIIGASGKPSKYKGVAPNVNLVNFRVLDANGASTDSAVIAAIDQAIQLSYSWRYNVRVINLSLGRPVFEPAALDPLCQAVERAWKAGIVVVVAAGNNGRDNSVGENGYGTINSPANDPYVITVGAMKAMGTKSRSDDFIASYSSKGPTAFDHYMKPDLVAPGNLVVSTLSPGLTLSNAYPQNAVGSGCPDFVVEIKSPSDRLPVLRSKMEEWVRNGAQLGWLIDPEQRTVEIFYPDAKSRVVSQADTLAGELPVAEFVLDLRLIWNPLPEL